MSHINLLGRLALFILIFSPALANATIELTFGAYTADKPTLVVRQFKPVLNALSDALSRRLNEKVTIRMQVFSTYDAGIEAIVKGNVDIMRLGPASYITVKDRSPGVQILAVESKKGKKLFKGIICTNNDSAIQEIGDLRGKRFAFGDRRSTIGRYLSQNLLRENGITELELGAYEYLGRHDKVGHAVGAGLFDAGALKESTFKKLVAKGIPIRALVSFPNVTKPWIARAEFSDRIVSNLTASLLAMQDPVALKHLKKDGFLAGDDSDYQVIREAMAENYRFFEKIVGTNSQVSVE